MSTNTITTGTSAAKTVRLQLGTLPGPITATRAFSKPIGDAESFAGKVGQSWVVLTPEGRMVRANTYDGNLGKKFSVTDHNSEVIPSDEKVLTKKLKGYTEVTSDLPAFINLVSQDATEGDAAAE
jgi:hypothetical protein